MNKTDKEMAVELAIAIIRTIPEMRSAGPKQPLSDADVKAILESCYNAIRSLN